MSQADMLTFQHVPTNRANRRLVVDHRLRRHCQSSLRRSRRRCGKSSRCSPLSPSPVEWNGCCCYRFRCLFVYFVENVSVTIVYIIHTEIYVYKYVYIYVYNGAKKRIWMLIIERLHVARFLGCAQANGMLNVSSQVSVPVAWQGKAWWFFDNTLYIQVFCFQFMTTRFDIHPSKTKDKVLRTCNLWQAFAKKHKPSATKKQNINTNPPLRCANPTLG